MTADFEKNNLTIFESLQSNIDADAIVKENIKEITQTLERQSRTTLSALAVAHSKPQAQLSPVIQAAENLITEEIKTVKALDSVVSGLPYYKYNGIWTKDIQTVILSLLLCAWLGGIPLNGQSGQQGKLLTIEECGEILHVPVNLKDRDDFHIAIEEYLHALISLIEELTRLAVNAVTLGDYDRPLQISKFVKDIHAGFQILNLRNDSLRRRSDSIKYNVKRVEDIVYDLSLRDLLPK